MKRFEPTVFRQRMHTLDKKKRWFLLVPIEAIENDSSTMHVYIQNNRIFLHSFSTIDVIDEDSLEKLYDSIHFPQDQIS